MSDAIDKDLERACGAAYAWAQKQRKATGVEPKWNGPECTAKSRTLSRC